MGGCVAAEGSDILLVSPLNLLSVPALTLRRHGLGTSVVCGALDPSGRVSNLRFDVYASIYTEDGRLAWRGQVGHLEPGEWRAFDVEAIAAAAGVGDGALAVLHRVPPEYGDGRLTEDCADPGRHGFHSHLRSVIRYTDAGGRHGSVLYEIPPRFNEPRPGARATNLTFAPMISTQPGTTTLLVILNYSTSAAYAVEARLSYRLLDAAGTSIQRGTVAVPPFGGRVVAFDGAALAAVGGPVTLLGHSEDTALIPLFVVVRAGGGVSVEHSHPPQSYVLSSAGDRDARAIKTAAAAVL